MQVFSDSNNVHENYLAAWQNSKNINATGIVAVPRGSKGPRSLYLRRYGNSFGFTLRHFIVYPPESIGDDDGRHAACGALNAPMDTIFVKDVRERSPAKQAGLQRGDRIVAVNNIVTAGRTYQQVVQLISNSPEYLHLLVVPKEEDVLQRFFPDTAYNPLSNQTVPYQEPLPLDRVSAKQILTQRIAQQRAIGPQEFRVDAASWRYLHQPYFHEYPGYYPQGALLQARPVRSNRQDFSRVAHQRSAESVLDSRSNQQEIYAEIHQPNEVQYRQKSRAQPQVPLYRKMGRRASEGSNLLSSSEYSGPTSLNSEGGSSEYYSMKAMHNEPYYLPSNGERLNMGIPDGGCRLRSSDVATRRESTSSLASSIADSSKDSITSFGSNSTLTGHEIDDSARISRVRQSVRQKEEFLRTPVLREFHSRPKKLGRPVWPPIEPIRSDKQSKPLILGSVHGKNDEHGAQGGATFNGGVPDFAMPPADAHSPMGKRGANQGVREAETAPSFEPADVNETARQTVAEVRRSVINYILAYLLPMMNPIFQNVQKKAKEFENYPEDTRTHFSRSELARLTKKVLLPNVTERAHEYEVKTNTNERKEVTNEEQRKPVELPEQPTSLPPTSTSSAAISVLKRIQRDSRSLDSSGSNSSIYEPLTSLTRQRLSGNVLISSGSKYIHCPPPGTEPKTTDVPSNNEPQQFRARSNSAESWTTAIGDKDSITATPPPQTPIFFPALSCPSPLIPESVLQIQAPPQFPPPAISVTPPRPHTLDLDQPERPARGHFKLTSDGSSSNIEPIVVKRRLQNRLGYDDRAKRPESYLRATKNDQNSFGSDYSDYEEVTPQVLRNRYRKWHPSPFHGDIEQLRKMFEDAASSKGGSGSGNSSNSSLDRDKTTSSPGTGFKKEFGVIREGLVNCKILEVDGKRAADRSWKQVTMILKGPKLFLFKDKHQSPLGSSDISLDQSLASGVDMRTSAVRVAGDYTKRKNVLRMSTVKPCRSEFLIQAESSEDFADWVKTLQQQVAVSTDAELDHSGSTQQAVPQLHPASTTIQVQGSHLSPQPSAKNGKSSSSSRNRSPTGQSPVSKTRKPSHQENLVAMTSPKSKTWRGRVAKQFKKFNQGASSPCSPTAPDGSTFGVPIEHCITSHQNSYLPRFVEVCTDIIDEKGLQVIGIYRVPGNNASMTALSEEINRNFDEVPLDDPRWNDLHVVSSLLKAFLRKMPESLVTSALYPHFIKADKIEDHKLRLEELRKLVRNLPKHNYHTLKHVIRHLKRVADNSDANRMEAKNLAIVFGPTIVRPESETMESMVTNMTNQCKIVESLIANADWFFPETDNEAVLVPLAVPDYCDDFEMNNHQALLNNISKYEALKDQKEKNGALLSSLFTAAHRKVMRKPSRTHHHESIKDEPTTPTNQRTFDHFGIISEADKTSDRGMESGKINSIPPSTDSIEVPNENKQQSAAEKNSWFNYKTDQSDFSRRIELFKKETEAMLQKPRITEISVDPRGPLSSSASNVNTTSRLVVKPHHDYLLTKTHSATNVFSRPIPSLNRNSLNSMDPTQYSTSSEVTRHSYGAVTNNSVGTRAQGDLSSSFDTSRYGIRRGSSVENMNSSALDLNSNGGLKKTKFESENDGQRRGSLDSLHKLPTDDESLLSTMTKLIDQKLKEKSTDDIPYVDEPSPEKPPTRAINEIKESKPKTNDLYKNPSLHKSQYSSLKLFKPTLDQRKELKNELTEKEEDTKALESDVPDNERHISLTLIAQSRAGSKLRRSESLNKPERTITPISGKVRRSESLKRSDSLTKTEKTESNINKRREILASGRRLKESTKNKRKNGMPDRSIKRRHTVGGTKDPDKVTYLMDTNRNQENDPNIENNKDKGIRTSSPDLSSTRRERFLFEINLIGPDNMVVALRQHLIGSRPQSFPESNVFKMPLESHV
ncbi:rho GTPase-activating protein 23 isoform X2 [Euwallacea similis]|uniref:rho GTPase-activating protein 23 isoform X2 n=1 Tax=Euwallacea similis TaxID=1736056 RepID=UPI00344C195B